MIIFTFYLLCIPYVYNYNAKTIHYLLLFILYFVHIVVFLFPGAFTINKLYADVNINVCIKTSYII